MVIKVVKKENNLIDLTCIVLAAASAAALLGRRLGVELDESASFLLSLEFSSMPTC